jgi:hypothetical protein
LVIAVMVLQKFEDGRLWPVSFISRNLYAAKLEHNVFDQEMLAVDFPFWTWR